MYLGYCSLCYKGIYSRGESHYEAGMAHYRVCIHPASNVVIAIGEYALSLRSGQLA
jgi:hypothetical protein